LGLSGNTANIKKNILQQLEILEEESFPRHLLVSPELAARLAVITHAIDREVAVYLDRHGKVNEVMLGDSNTTLLIKTQIRRSTSRLSGLRCIHTHPGGDSTLSKPDISCLYECYLDAIVAIGTLNGRVTTIQAAFIEPDYINETGKSQDKYRHYGPLDSEELEAFPFLDILMEIDRQIINPTLHELEIKQEKALLVGFKQQKGSLLNGEDSLIELEELAKTAGAFVYAKQLLNIDKPTPGYYIGTGKLKEIALYRQEHSLDLIIFDNELSPHQQANLQETLGCSVVDRTALILQIFADRAKTKEGILQVELAQLSYLLPRLTGLGASMSRLGGGIGTRGPGETKLETDRRHIRGRINDLKNEIETIKKQRKVLRQQRQENRVPVAALIGYTNAGKSTLMNTLTNAGVLAENKLFATLDTTTRRLKLKQTEILLSDTVGFIHKLPHQLIAAFRATLEEIKYADLLIHILDASNPAYEAHIQSVNAVLHELAADDIPAILVFNKWDQVADTVELSRNLHEYEPALPVSALTGYNIPELLELIQTCLPNQPTLVKLLLPFAQTSLLSRLYKEGEVLAVEYTEVGISCSARLTEPLLSSVKPYMVKEAPVN